MTDKTVNNLKMVRPNQSAVTNTQMREKRNMLVPNRGGGEGGGGPGPGPEPQYATPVPGSHTLDNRGDGRGNMSGEPLPLPTRDAWWEVTFDEIGSYAAGFKQQEESTDGPGIPRPNSGYLNALPEPQNSPTQFWSGSGVQNGSGGDTPIVTSYDIKQVTGETNYPEDLVPSGEVVTPRAGTHFLVMRIDKRKRYDGYLNSGTGNEPWLDKPRCSMSFNGDAPDNRVDAWDDVYWTAFSVYVPENFEVDSGENFFKGRNIGLGEFGYRAGYNHFVPHIGLVKKGTDSDASWVTEAYTNPDGDWYGSNKLGIGFGLITEDRGQWTDWVYRFRANPFSVPTNIPNDLNFSNAVPGDYPANQGILEIYKSVGPKTGRYMKKVYSRVNQPFGTAPSSRNGGTRILNTRVYKHSWKRIGGETDWRPSNSNAIGPEICLPRDELRAAKESLGQGFSDVDVQQRSEPTNTPVKNVDWWDVTGDIA